MSWLSSVVERVTRAFVTDDVTPALDRLSEALKGQDAAARRLAVQQLATMRGDAATSLLAGALRDGDAAVRETAATALGERGAGAAIPGLAVLLDDAEPAVRRAAVAALDRIGAPRKEVLRSKLGVSTSPVLPDARIPELLRRATSDADPTVRFAALSALPWQGASGVGVALDAWSSWGEAEKAQAGGMLGDALVLALGSRDFAHRRAIVEALGRTRGPEAAAAIVAAMDDDDAEVRQAAVRLAAEIAPAQALPSLVARLDDSDDEATSEAISAIVVAWKAGALDAGDADRVHERVRRIAAHGKGRAQRLAAWALGEMGRVSAVATLIDLLDTPSHDLRASCCEALGRLGDPRGVQPMLDVSALTEPLVRATIARSLGALRDPRAIPRLATWLLIDPDPSVVAAVESALDASCGDAESASRDALASSVAELRLAAIRRAAGDARLVRPLLASLLDAPDDATRNAALDALRRHGVDVQMLLHHALGQADQREDRRLFAIAACAALRDGSAPRLLERILSDTSEPPAAWRLAAASLKQIGSSEALHVLKKNAEHANPIVKEAVAEALAPPPAQ